MADEMAIMDAVWHLSFRWHSTYLEKFQNGLISKNEMYPENEKVIKHMLKEFATLPITYIGEEMLKIKLPYKKQHNQAAKAISNPENVCFSSCLHHGQFNCAPKACEWTLHRHV